PVLEAIPGVSVTGWQPRAEIRRHLARARCLVFPSLWYETYGLTVDEAASCGVPAIVSDISAAAERVEDGVSGWHFCSGDSADLVRCLKLIEDDALVRTAGLAAYDAFWRRGESADTHARRLIRIYRQAMQA
ncbi:MAG TPA: glycosyltransferase, partial [Stellaceae bacterium]|nr:glycosyltransferase [Stellaceae bacterium]